MKINAYKPFLAIFLAILLGACSSLGTAAIDAVKVAYGSGRVQSYASQPLAPQFAYLEVHTPEASALMALAYVEPGTPYGPSVQTWMSARKEVLRTQGGFFAASQGVPNLWESAILTFDPTGLPRSWIFDSPKDGLYNVKQIFSPVPFEQLDLDQSELLRRAQVLPGLKLMAWRVQSEAGIRAGADVSNLLQVVGLNPQTGLPVYGMHCSRTNYCVEYLYRTASANL